MSSDDIAKEITASFPDTDEVIVTYLSGYLLYDPGEEEDVFEVTRSIMESVAGDRRETLENLMQRLSDLLQDQLRARKEKSETKLLKLDKVMNMSKNAISNPIAFSESVDVESINKGKYV
jgi:ATP-binding cassette, subfamily F, member 3